MILKKYIFMEGGDFVALTAKQQAFVAEYLIDLNATQAALRAGYSEKTAGSIGNENLKKPEIQEAISDARKKRAERTEVDQDYVIRKLKEIADKEASDMTESDLKYSNKIRALELLGKHTGAFEGRQETNDRVTVVIDV